MLPQHPQEPTVQEAKPWKWSYNRWVGIMYGPIPVGVIIVVIGFIVYAMVQ